MRKIRKKRLGVLVGLTIVVIGAMVMMKNKFTTSSTVNNLDTASLEPSVYKPVVCLDAGHGGDDVGAVELDRYEKDDTLAITKLIKTELEAFGVEVILTRDDDTSLDNAPRAQFANTYKADVFVSLHRNYYEEDRSIQGVEAWINSESFGEDVELANSILDQIKKGVSATTMRGVKAGTMDGEGDYTVNLVTNMPACILELGFITNSNDNKLYDTYLKEYAKAIAKGIHEYVLTIT